jgi:hypothetical protein
MAGDFIDKVLCINLYYVYTVGLFRLSVCDLILSVWG